MPAVVRIAMVEATIMTAVTKRSTVLRALKAGEMRFLA